MILPHDINEGAGAVAPATTCSAPVYSSKPQVAAIELLDGAYDIIEIWKAESPSQKAWKTAWLSKARELGANPSW
jgi:hypothetical protein